jgi:hypothetical protein
MSNLKFYLSRIHVRCTVYTRPYQIFWPDGKSKGSFSCWLKNCHFGTIFGKYLQPSKHAKCFGNYSPFVLAIW